jgi:hypothetical protein
MYMSEANDANPSEIERQLSSVTAVITGTLAKPQENIVKAMGTIVQRGLQRKLIQGFSEAWEHLEKEGRVRPDYLNTFHGAANFQEVLRALELDDTDKARFEAVQNIFLHGALLDDDKNVVLIVRLMKAAVQLSGGEILILRAMYEDKAFYNNPISRQTWEEDIARSTGLKHIELVQGDIARLQDQHLIAISETARGSGESPGLTGLGIELCKYMESPVPM